MKNLYTFPIISVLLLSLMSCISNSMEQSKEIVSSADVMLMTLLHPDYLKKYDHHDQLLPIINLLEQGVNINAVLPDQTTYLYNIATEAHIALAELLLQHHANPNQRHINGETALHQAVRRGSDGVVKLLLKHGAIANIKNNDGNTPLHIAALNNKNTILSKLLKNKVGVNEFNNQGVTPLHLACHNQNIGAIKLLITHRADANIEGSWGFPLAQCITISTDLIKWMISIGKADPNVSIDSIGNTVLHAAAVNGALDLVRIAIEHHASIDMQNNNQETPLHLAVFNNKSMTEKIEIIRLLLFHKAEPNIKNRLQATPLHLALYNKNTAGAFLLMQYGADPNLQGPWGSPLEQSIGAPNNLIEYMLNHGAHSSYNAFKRAMQNDEIEHLQLLLTHYFSTVTNDSYDGIQSVFDTLIKKGKKNNDLLLADKREKYVSLLPIITKQLHTENCPRKTFMQAKFLLAIIGDRLAKNSFGSH